MPLDVAVATDGSVLVVDAGRGDVQRFSAEGEMLGIMPRRWRPRRLEGPRDRDHTEANGTIYDVDLANGWLNSWMPDGSFRSSLLSGGTGSASLSVPFLAAPTNTRSTRRGTSTSPKPTGSWCSPRRASSRAPGSHRAPSDGGWMPIAVASDGTVYLSAGSTIYKLRVADRTPVPEASDAVAGRGVAGSSLGTTVS